MVIVEGSVSQVGARMGSTEERRRGKKVCGDQSLEVFVKGRVINLGFTLHEIGNLPGK